VLHSPAPFSSNGVTDTLFGADLTIVEEGHELLERIAAAALPNGEFVMVRVRLAHRRVVTGLCPDATRVTGVIATWIGDRGSSAPPPRVARVVPVYGMWL